MIYVFLSHDVDWRKRGPPIRHVLARKERFTPEVLAKIREVNPYYNIPRIMEMEEKLGVRSTFFFRTRYEGASLSDYESDIKALTSGGWEVALHLDPSSTSNARSIKREKLMLEELSGRGIVGNRVHYLRCENLSFKALTALGFAYDSSIRQNRDGISPTDMGYYTLGGIVEFPISIMDADLFAYMKLKEEEIIPSVYRALKLCEKLKKEPKVLTMLWHDASIKMVGGRVYFQLLERLAAHDKVRLCKGEELTKIVLNALKN